MRATEHMQSRVALAGAPFRDVMSVPEGPCLRGGAPFAEFLISFMSLSRGLFLIDAVRFW